MNGSQSDKHSILILDGDRKNSLAIVRHLGKTKKYILDVVSYNKHSIAFYSTYTAKKHLTANPAKDPEQFLKDILTILSEKRYVTILPVSYISYQICAANKEKIQQHTHITISSYENIRLASSKVATYDLAEKIGVPYPKVFHLSSLDDIHNLQPEYPCVIKAPFEAGKNIVEYASNNSDLIRKYHSVCKNHDFKGVLPIVQKYIHGEGVGFFAFYKDGVCKNAFIHRRIREYPVTGGASTVAESFQNEQIEKDGRKILDHLKWEGVAMVEFKKDDTTGIYNLMEINAKFWGSLDLALTAGVNFPQMLIDNALNKDISPVETIKNIRFQWVLNGDLFNIMERPWHIFSFIKDLFIAKNDVYIRDLKPNLFQLLYIPLHYYKKWFT